MNAGYIDRKIGRTAEKQIKNIMELPATAVVFLLSLLAFATHVKSNAEGDALFAQKRAWKDPSNVLKSWDPTLANPCSWFHVTCNNDNSVIRVDLGTANISGPLVPQLGLLSNLQYLELYGNSISGRIPPELGKLTKLVSIGLQQNRLVGPIPSTLGKIKTLVFLRLNGNMLTGTIPLEILNLVRDGKLALMNVSDNYLDGTARRTQLTGLEIITIITDPRARS